MISPINGAVADPTKPRRTSWNKAKVIDYSMLKRYSVAYLLRLMRSGKDEAKRFKTALEVVTKDIGKQVIDQSNHNHYTIHSLAKELNGTDGYNPRVRVGVPEAVCEPDVVLPEGVGLKALAETAGDHAISQGQPENDGTKL